VAFLQREAPESESRRAVEGKAVFFCWVVVDQVEHSSSFFSPDPLSIKVSVYPSG
jgi:hypothetical protein